MHEPIADRLGHRGVVYEVFERAPGEWDWTFHPKVGEGQKTTAREREQRV